ncbi:hypothetical protein [Brachybacterium aquaticum]|uniref:Uncharacterized protein n=1 Tax=Brachybacterium aquaticum TaxID=1432564 RepID=A0A841AAG8_9MICO|nr:hypothetical protein [Brachybacterium aquaticum]MBB5831846.1 hypothetical protein [Brachybacterium aquaticum]
MSSSRRTPARAALDSTVRAERERIRALLLELRPALGARLVVGPSGALVIPLRTGGSVEIGRMRRRGAARWVVVAPSADGARVREPVSLRSVARAAVAAVDEGESGRALSAVR